MRQKIELVIYPNEYHGKVIRVPIEIERNLARQLYHPIELSDDPLSIYLSGQGRKNTNPSREMVLSMRKTFANEIAQQIKTILLEEFGKNDVLNGYSK